MRHVKNEEYAEGYKCVRFHPDGLILGTGTGDALVRIWDMKQAVRSGGFPCCVLLVLLFSAYHVLFTLLLTGVFFVFFFVYLVKCSWRVGESQHVVEHLYTSRPPQNER